MKKYFKLTLYFIVLSITLTSCNDQLERAPIDKIEESTAYQTVADLRAGLLGAIGSIDINNTIAFNSIFSDNCKVGKDNGGQRLNTLNQILNPNAGDDNIWDDHYQSINNFNRVIRASNGVTVLSGEQEEFDNIIAQCYAFRAYLHAEIALYYSLDLLDPNAGAIPYQNTVATSGTLSRVSTADLMTQIDTDLSTASSLLPASANDINFVTQDFITFVRARMALYTGDYTNAITYATSLINNYSLANTSQYSDMYNDDNTTEVIYKYDNVLGFNRNIAQNWIFTGSGTSFVEMGMGLFTSYDANDIRRSVVTNPNSDPANNELNINKYPAGDDTNYINDFKAMRASELYLIRAEANARKNSPDFASAAADVQAIRTARYTSAPAAPSYSNLIDAIRDIKLERRRELSFEGHRYIDIKRYRNILNEGIVRDPLDCQGSFPCSLDVSSPKFTFPIPQVELTANPDIQQAPGY